MVRLVVDRLRWSWWLFFGFAVLARFPASASAGAEPRGVLSLQDALAAAADRAPSLRGFRAELEVRDAEALQASLPPNPDVELEQENFAGTGNARAWNEAETTLGVSMPLELGAKRERRVELAQLDRRLTEWDHREARRAVRLATADAFVRTLAAQERLARARESAELERALLATVERGVRAGAAAVVEAKRAALAVSRADTEVDRLGQELAAARLALAASWGASEPTFEAVRGDLARLEAPPAIDELLAKVEAWPAVSRFGDEGARARAVLALEEARAAPDLRLGVGVRHLAADDDVAMVASVGVPLPLFDRNQGAIEAARRSSMVSADRADAARIESAAAVRALHHEASAAFARVDRLRGSLLPEAEGVYREAREAYQRGLFRLTDVLETQRSLFELRLELIDELERHQRAAVALELAFQEGESR